MGVFDVNMPLLYGEGRKAFFRLQEEIIKQTDDHSIFAWPMPSHLPSTNLLADSPAEFRTCQLIRTMPHPRTISPDPEMSFRAKPHTMTNRGLSIRFMALHDNVDIYLVRLNCTVAKLPHETSSLIGNKDDCLGIFIQRLDEDDQYVRVQSYGKSI